MPYLAKPSVADAVDKQQMLGLSERAVLLTEFDDLSSKLFTDKGDALKVGAVGGIDINGISGDLGGWTIVGQRRAFCRAAGRKDHR
jgi:hypothetical protein